MAEYVQVATTTDSEEAALKIAEAVVKERHAACAQIIGPIASTYWWKDKLETAKEWLCLMKTPAGKYSDLERAILEIHPYEEPEIIATSIVNGSLGYLEWLEKETR